MHLELAQSLSIEREIPHHYVAGKTGTTVTITLEPGNPDVEKAVRIVQGMQRDGSYSQLHTVKINHLAFVVVMADLTDSYPVEEMKAEIDALLNSGEAYRVKLLKQQLLGRYCMG